MQICKNWIFNRKIQLYSKNVCKKNCPKNDLLYIFEKPLTMPFQICKSFCKILNNLICNQEKQKMCGNFPLTGSLQEICNFFFAKPVQFVFLCQRLSKKLNFIKIWQVEVGQNKDLVCYRKKHSFRQCALGLRQLVLKPGFIPIALPLCKKKLQGGLNMQKYAQKFVRYTQKCVFPRHKHL